MLVDLSSILSAIIVITAITIMPSTPIIIIPMTSTPAITNTTYSSGTHDIDTGGSISIITMTTDAVYDHIDCPFLRLSLDPDAVYIAPMLKNIIVADIECAENR